MYSKIKRMEARIVGGMFGSEGFEKHSGERPEFMSGNCLFLANGRCGMHLLCRLIKPRKVWLPSYLCHAMVESIPNQDVIEFYPIGEDLHVINQNWVSDVAAEDLVIFIDYFGFDLHRDAMRAVKERGAHIMQDAAQALLSTFDRPYADFVLFSPRKVVGVPDGGILQSQCDEDFTGIQLEMAPTEFIAKAYAAFVARSDFDKGIENDWFSLYQMAESLNPIGAFRMSDFSYAMLRQCFDYKAIAAKRISNFLQLDKALGGQSLLGPPQAGAVPLGLPIIVDKREDLLARLYTIKLFCPVHWKLGNAVPEKFEESHRLSHRILTLITDQRCNGSQINEFKDTVTGFQPTTI